MKQSVREQGLSPANLPPCSDACATLLLTSADDGREDHAADDRRGDRLRLAVAALLARHLALELRERAGRVDAPAGGGNGGGVGGGRVAVGSFRHRWRVNLRQRRA